jgi:hypothetical protein
MLTVTANRINKSRYVETRLSITSNIESISSAKCCRDKVQRHANLPEVTGIATAPSRSSRLLILVAVSNGVLGTDPVDLGLGVERVDPARKYVSLLCSDVPRDVSVLDVIVEVPDSTDSKEG